MSVKERLKNYIKSQGLSVTAFEKSINVSNGYVNSISKGIGSNVIESILEKYPNFNLEWILTGKEIDYVVEPQQEYKGVGVPYYDLDFTLGFLEVMNNQQIKPDSYVTHPFFKGCDCIVRASGQSMAKIIKHGDAIGLVKIDNWKEFIPMGEVYAIVTTNGFRMVKVIDPGEDKDSYTLKSKPTDNKKDDFPDQQIKKSMILSIFKVQASSHLL